MRADYSDGSFLIRYAKHYGLGVRFVAGSSAWRTVSNSDYIHLSIGTDNHPYWASRGDTRYAEPRRLENAGIVEFDLSDDLLFPWLFQNQNLVLTPESMPSVTFQIDKALDAMELTASCAFGHPHSDNTRT